MKPYLAIIVDSFHSALASRILWVAFIAIWIFLGALAPIGYREEYTTTFRWIDLEKGTQMKAMLARGLVDPNESETALGRIAGSLPEKLQRKLKQVAKDGEIRIDKTVLADALNEAIDDESWYEREAWSATVRLRELRELDEIPDDEIGDEQRRRRARLRIEAALPGVFAAQSARSITLTYAGFDFPAIFSIGKDQFILLVNQVVVPLLMNWMLGFALIFLGVLVTSSMIPEMLQPGSLHLLLSKPISRSLLLVSKFIGGCSFVFICVSQVVIGLYVIAGFRLDLWNPRLLWCIPVLVFLFSVYFSVSILAGLQWRSPVLSIGITCMFGAFVIVVGFIGGNFDRQVTSPDKINSFAFTDDGLVASTIGRGLKRFDEESNEWTELMKGVRRFDLIVPPVAIDETHLVSARIRNGRFNLYGSGSLDLLVLDSEDDFQPAPNVALPIGTRKLIVVGDSLIALNNVGLMRASIEKVLREHTADELDAAIDDSEEEDSGEEDKDTDSPLSSETLEATAWISDLFRMQGGDTDEFHLISPQRFSFSDPVRVDALPQTNSLVAYAHGRMARLELPDENRPRVTPANDDSSRATIAAEIQFAGEGSVSVAMAASGGAVLVAREDEPVRWLDAVSLEELAQWELPGNKEVLSLRAIADTERFLAITSDARLHVVTRDGDKIESSMLPPREVVAASYDPLEKRLAVSHHIDQVAFFPIDADGNIAQKPSHQLSPTLHSWRSIDAYALSPLRAVTPQTIEFGDTMAALISGESAFAFGDDSTADREVIQLRIARPILSCSAFILVVMGISCFFFSRRDF